MPTRLPFVPGVGAYKFTTTIESVTYTFNVHWNGRDSDPDNGIDGAWYFDLLEADGTPIVTGVKVVLGTYLGRTCAHEFFQNGVLVAIDNSGDKRDPGFDDLGARVELWHFTTDALLGELAI